MIDDHPEAAPTATDQRSLKDLPAELYVALRDDPMRAPETIALAASEWHGPAAAEWVARMRSRYDYDGRQLAKMAKRKHAQLARLSGAAGGVGGFLAAAPDTIALLWIETRMVFHVAASFGYDPLDRMRPAEVLVLFDMYDDPVTARKALDRDGAPTVAEAFITRRTERRENLASLITRWAAMYGTKKLSAKAIPGIAIPLNAISNERETRGLADRAIRFYGG